MYTCTDMFMYTPLLGLCRSISILVFIVIRVYASTRYVKLEVLDIGPAVSTFRKGS